MRLPSSSATKRSAPQNAESIRSQGVLSPLLVRPLTDQSFEIVAGARRYRAAKIAEASTVPVRIVNLTDAEALEAQLLENLQRENVHPLEEAQGLRFILHLVVGSVYKLVCGFSSSVFTVLTA
jgi:ParB family transcriptional regulator, chromosome partitioning protein